MAKTDTETTNKRLQELMSKSLTGALPLVITDTNANTGINAYAIYAISDATFTTLNVIAEGDDLSTQTLSAGHIWYVPINGTVTLAGGAVIVYQHEVSGN
jgi:hypothetical protein